MEIILPRPKSKKMVVDFELTIDGQDYEAIHYECPICGAHILQEQMVCSCGVKFKK